MHGTPPKRYVSKRDGWLSAILWCAVGVQVGTALWLPTQVGPAWFSFGFSAFVLAAAALVLWVLYGTWYELAGEVLRVRSGPFRWTLPLAAIESVTPSRNPLSSPACSLDRIHIRHDGSRLGILLSPLEAESFVADLALRTGLERTGPRDLVRGR